VIYLRIAGREGRARTQGDFSIIVGILCEWRARMKREEF
jgi:hypothetical protein